MDDGEGGLSFDFEGGLDTGPAHPTASVPVIQSASGANAASSGPADGSNNPAAAPVAVAQPADGFGGGGRRSFRQTVCRHWLRSLCMKGDACGFLHQYDKSRMPVCRFFRLYGECREQDCVYKHTNEDIKECNMYKLGFCPNGPDCRYRHAKLPGPPPPVEEVLLKIQQLTSNNYGNNRFFQNRNDQQTYKSQFHHGSNGMHLVGRNAESGFVHQQPQQAQQSQQQGSQGQIQNTPNGQQNQASRTATPLPQGTSRYFVVKSCNRENLELSVRQGVWATQRSNEAKLNEAFESVENVILIFSINKTRNFQGCAKMTSKIGGSIGGGNWKHAHGTAHYGRNFALKWLKLCELSFDKTRYLRNPYNENLPVKISRDCQELEPSVGEQLASLLYLEPDSDLMAISLAAEQKREEENAKGVNVHTTTENPDIVPFEDNEEDDDDEDEEEDEEIENDSESQGNFLGRGRGGRGMMWTPHMPLPRGPPLFPAVRAFPPNMIAGDGFSYGPPIPLPPDPFAMGPRGFGPYGPRFSGDFGGLRTGMMFPGGLASGFGMMMGPSAEPGRAPFSVGGLRGGRPPMSMPPLYPPQSQPQPQPPLQNSNQANRGDETALPNREKHEGRGHGSMADENGNQERGKSQGGDRDGGGNGYSHEESESEDEAPRRSRHGEGKKKRRGSEADGAEVSGEIV